MDERIAFRLRGAKQLWQSGDISRNAPCLIAREQIGRTAPVDSGLDCSLFVLMTKAQWTRWGRGMCEGWSLEIGVAFRGTVVRQERLNQPTTWLASVNAGYLGEYFDRATAMARVEDTIEHNMKLVLEDWEVYRATKEQRTLRWCEPHA